MGTVTRSSRLVILSFSTTRSGESLWISRLVESLGGWEQADTAANSSVEAISFQRVIEVFPNAAQRVFPAVPGGGGSRPMSPDPERCASFRAPSDNCAPDVRSTLPAR